MHSVSRVLACGLILGTGVAILRAQTPDPRIGTWTLNTARSSFSPGPAPRSITLKVVPSGEGETVTAEIVVADGRQIVSQYTANYDGKDYPLTGSPTADTVSLKRIDVRTTERVDKKDGTVVQTIRRVVSADGKTMNTTATGRSAWQGFFPLEFKAGQPVANTGVFEKR